MQRVGKRTKAHGAGTGGDGKVATLANAHLVGVDAHLRVIGGIEGANRAGQRLSQGGLIVRLALVHKEAVGGKDLLGQDAVGGVTAAELVGVARRVHRALVVDCGLDHELLARLVQIGVLGANLHDVAGKLMARDGRMLRRIGVDALVVGAELGHLVGGHANRVGDDLNQHLVIGDLGKLKLLQTQIHSGVEPDCLSLHRNSFLLSFLVQSLCCESCCCRFNTFVAIMNYCFESVKCRSEKGMCSGHSL